MDSWKFRDELLQSLTQWYLILGFVLLGVALGFAFSYIIPGSYQAVSDLYIGIDVERVNHLEYIIPLAEEEPLNLDDYKNWQLKQVADILTSDNVLNKTLTEIHQTYPELKELTLQDLRSAIDIYWYDTGTWRMEVVLPQKVNAVSVVNAWTEVGYKEIFRLLEISKTGNSIDQQIWSDNLAVSEIKLQKAKYKAISSSCNEWIAKLGEFSGTNQIDPELYSEISEWVQLHSGTASFSLDTFFDIPQNNETINVFIQWFTDKQLLADKAVDILKTEQSILEEERSEILPEFHKYLDDSLGLSANLILHPDTSETDVKQIYSSDRFAIGGSLLGLLAWVVFTAVRISSRKEDHGN